MEITFEQVKPSMINLKKVVVADYMRNRVSTGINFLDECLGSKENPGFIIGSVILLAADPGAGKSTLLRQMAACSEIEVLYNIGEESFEQVKMAVERMELETAFNVSNYRRVEDLIDQLVKTPHQLVVLDSLQNLYTDTDHKGNPLGGRPGSKSQMVTVVEKLYAYAKATLTTFFCICHSTKGGDFAGPQTVEHTIDVSIHIEVTEDKEAGMTYRQMRAEKNRFGEALVDYNLTMGPKGLTLGDNPPPQSAKKGKRKTNHNSIRANALKLYGEGTECALGREEFVKQLMAATECSVNTAMSNYYGLRREIAMMQPAS